MIAAKVLLNARSQALCGPSPSRITTLSMKSIPGTKITRRYSSGGCSWAWAVLLNAPIKITDMRPSHAILRHHIDDIPMCFVACILTSLLYTATSSAVYLAFCCYAPLLLQPRPFRLALRRQPSPLDTLGHILTHPAAAR